MDVQTLISIVVLLLAVVYLYFIGTVIIHSLRLSILQVKSDVKIKLDRHYQDLEGNQLMLESKKAMLTGKTPEQQKKPKLTTIELGINGDTNNLKEALESIDYVRKFVIMADNILLDIKGEVTPTQLIEDIENKSKITVTQVSIAKNTDTASAARES